MNHYADLRRWLKEEQNFKQWQNLEMQWIQGHNPDLVILDERGQEKETIDLTEYNYDGVGELLRKKGFRMKGEM